MSAIKVTALVLAAGTSSRMGTTNKLILPWKKHTLVDEVILQLKNVHLHELIVVTSELTRDHFANKDLRVILNQAYLTGMTSSIQAGIRAADPTTNGYMICLADQPLITSDDYGKLVDSFAQKFQHDSDTIIVPFYKGKKGNPVIFSAAYKDLLLQHADPEGCKGIIQANEPKVSRIEIDNPGILQDIDTPEAYMSIKNQLLDTE